MRYLRFIMLMAISFIAVNASAIPISTEYLASESTFNSSAYDESTGKYYRSSHYSSNKLYVYDNKAQFESKAHTSVVTLQGGTYGTYFEVKGGKVYSRSDSFSSNASVWDATTGAKQTTRTIPNMGGSNGAHTFNWGGYSGVNFMEDQNNLYLMGRNQNSSGWQINEVDQYLNILNTVQYNQGSLGYAFIINDILFSSDNYYSNLITSAINLSTGIQLSVNFTLQGLGSLYLAGVNYVGAEDTLYLHNRNSGLYKIENASKAFNAPPTVSVAEPTTLALLGLGLAGLGLSRRRVAKLPNQ